MPSPESSLYKQLLAAREDVERHLEFLQNPPYIDRSPFAERPEALIASLQETLRQLDDALANTRPDAA